MERRIVSSIMVTLLLTAMLTLAFNIHPARAEPTIIIVPDDYEKIQWAIDHASNGATIFVRADIYYEHVVVNKSVSLIGEEPTSTIVDGGGSGGVIAVRANNTLIENFTIRNGDYGIRIGSDYDEEEEPPLNDCTIRNNVITNNTADGISFNGFWHRITNNTIIRNNITNNGHGIHLFSSYDNSISKNNITKNDFGVTLFHGYNNNIFDNNITKNGDGILFYKSSDNSISKNEITKNERDGVSVSLYSWDNSVFGNNITSNEYGITLMAISSGNTISGNNITSNNVGISVAPDTHDNYIYHNNFIDNLVQVSITEGLTSIWDDGYPSGGNYWSNYTGVDFFSGPHQDEPRSDGIGDTPYVIDEDNQDHYPLMNRCPFHNIAVKDVTSQTVVEKGHVATILVEIVNQGHFTSNFDVTVYANTMTIQTQTVTNLAPSQQLDLIFAWNTTGFPKGDYIVWAYAHPVQLEICIADNTFVCARPVRVVDVPVIIIIAGTYFNSLQTQIDYGCNEVFRILLSLGYDKDDIYYLNPSFQDVDEDGFDDRDGWSSATNLEYAIEDWAANEAGPTVPLYLYLFDHGGSEVFCIQNATGDFSVTSAQLGSWLDNLEEFTNASAHVIYAACHSGSFIDELSKIGRVVITSCRPDQSSWVSPDGKWEAFSQPFWRQIQSGHSVGWAFNRACDVVEAIEYAQDPLLDDNGDHTGHTGPLPNGGDGDAAFSLHITFTEWIFPWISHVAAKQFYIWPPPPTVTLWAKVENKTPLVHVKAWMKLPDAPSPPDGELGEMRLECFEMTDADQDGNFTVNIPAINFTNHASGPSKFKFIITAEEENGMTAIPLVTEVEFVYTFPSEDTSPPRVYLERPISGRMVQEVISINGTAMDDRSLERVALHVSGNLTQEISLPLASNSFFEFDFNTSKVSNGPATIFVEAFDTSGNSGNQTVEVMVNNFIHDIAMIDVAPSKTVVGQGSLILINVTIQNNGYFAETFNVTAYANTTIIATLTNITLTIGDSATITFTWNTTGFSYGNYTMSAVAETDTATITLIDGIVFVTVLGDVDDDGDVDWRDYGDFASVYGSKGPPQVPVPDPLYDPKCDFDNDGDVDWEDFGTLANNYGESVGP